jgi:hypothetical protein
LQIAGENESLMTDMLADAPKSEGGRSRHGKRAINRVAKLFCGKKVIILRQCDE